LSRAKLIRRLDELEALFRRSTASAEQRFLEGLSDEELDALYLRLGGEPEPEPEHRSVRRVVTSRQVEVATVDEPPAAVPEPEETGQAPEPAPTPPDLREVKGEPPVTALMRSCDYVPRSPWAEPPVVRGEGEEVTFRSEPLEPAYSVRPPRPRRRRSRRL
jgi:hypothetical protein